MKKILIGLLLSAGASVGSAGIAHAENAMYSCTDANGVESLTNVPQGQCVQLFTYSAPVEASAPAAPSVASAAAASGVVGEVTLAQAPRADQKAASAHRPSSKPVNAQRRDDALAQVRDAYAAGQPGAGNPATTRRYLMTNRVDYQRALGMIP